MPPAHATRAVTDRWWARNGIARLARPRCTAVVMQWVEAGGQRCLIGPRGSGRTSLLDVAVQALAAAGQPCLVFGSGRLAGSSVYDALLDMGESPTVPLFPDAGRRARHAARRLATAWSERQGGAPLRMVVDDFDALDTLTRSVVTGLMREPGASVLLVAAEAPEGVVPFPIPSLQPHELRAPGEAPHGLDVLRYPGSVLMGRLGSEAGARPGRWSSLYLTPSLPTEAELLLRVLMLSLVPIPIRALEEGSGSGWGGPDGDELVRARRLLGERGLTVEWGGRLRLAAPLDGRKLSIPHALVPELARRASSLLPADHPAQVPLAVASGRAPDAVLETAFRSVIQWDPARATRWGRALVQKTPSTAVAALTASAAQACRRRDMALLALEEALGVEADPEHQVALLSRMGWELLQAPADPDAARRVRRRVQEAAGAVMQPPAEMALLEAKLRFLTDGPDPVLPLLKASGASPHVFSDTPTLLRELEAGILAGMGRIDDAVGVWESLLSSAELPVQERVAADLAGACEAAGRTLHASEAWARLALLDRKVPDPVHVDALDKAAQLAQTGGDPGAAIEHWSLALQLASEARSTRMGSRLRPRLAAVYREVGRLEESDAVVDAALAEPTTPEAERLECLLLAADNALSRRALSEAGALIARAEAGLRARGRATLRLRVERRRCELAVWSEHPTALQDVQEAARTAHRCQSARELARLHAMAGFLLARAHRIDEAAAALARAEEPVREAGAGRLLAEVRVWATRAWLAVGDRSRAREVADRVLIWAEETGHLRLRDEARSLLQAAPAQPPEMVEPYDQFLALATRLTVERDPEKIHHHAVSACVELLGADRAFSVMVDGDGERVAAAHHRDGSGPGRPSRSVVRAVLGHGREVAVGDVEERAELRTRDSIVAEQVRSVMCVPMVERTLEGEQIVGVLYLDRPGRSQTELDRALRTLRAVAGLTCAALAAARSLAEARERTRRASELAHDLRSPAASLQMAGEELAAAKDVPRWGRETGQLIAIQAQRILRTGNRYLSNRRSVGTRFSLGGLASEVVRVAAPLARAAGRSVLVDVVDPVVVEAAEEDIQRVLLNLVQNAIRHTPPGSAVVLRVVRTPEGQARCEVIDAGDGIPTGLIDRIFERGVRGEGGGHGFGLAIALRLARSWGGALRVENRQPKGACFILTLPAA